MTNTKTTDNKKTKKSGVPTETRTPVTAVKGRCPRPLDDRDLLFCAAFQKTQKQHKKKSSLDIIKECPF